MTCGPEHEELARRVEELLAQWNASYQESGVQCASPVMDRWLAEQQVGQEMGLLPDQECRVCGCTDADGCVEVVNGRTGTCVWVDDDLCSACAEPGRPVATVEVKADVL